MSFVPNDAKSNKCTKCAKTVYPNEAIRAANGVYHKGCLRCTQCGITLNLKTCQSHESKPYCGTHVPKVGHTQVASVSMQTAMKAPRSAGKVQGVDRTQRMTFAPGRGAPVRGGAAGGAPRGGAASGAPRGAAAPSGGAPRGGAAASAGGYRGPNTVSVGGGGNKCPKCGKTVYTNEQIKACGSSWHKGCLKCSECGLTLNLKTLCSHQNKPYCSTHVPKVSHTQVASVEMQNALKAPKAARMQKGVNRAQRGTFAPGALAPTSGAEIVNPGGVSGSDIQSRHAPEQKFVAPEPTPHVEYDAPSSQMSNLSIGGGSSYDAGSYDQGGYDQGGYDQGGYDQGGYDQGGYDDSGYDQGGYEEPAYDAGGYEEPAYDAGGYEEQGSYDQGGYDQGGYDEGGYEEGGYEEGGYDEGGYDEGGYYEEGGYEEGGYDEGYYEEGGYDEGYYDEGY